MAGTLLAAVLVVMPLTVLTGSAAHASWGLNTCEDANNDPIPSLSPWSGGLVGNSESSKLIGIVGDGTVNYGATAYEWWGSNGMTFTTNNAMDSKYASEEAQATCGLGNAANRAAAGGLTSLLWAPLVQLNDTALWMTQQTQSMAFLPLLSEKVVVPVTSGLDGNGGGLGDIYKQSLLFIILVTACWAAWKVIRRRSKEAVQGIAWNLAVSIVGLVLIAMPTLLPNATMFVLQTGQGVVSGVAMAITDTISGDARATELCTLNDGVGEAASTELTLPDGTTSTVYLPSKGTRQATCAMWVTTVYAAWMQGQFGTTQDPMTETYRSADGTQDPTRWDSSVNDADIATTIPGLATQPPAGSLAALALNATSLNAAEQRWQDAVVNQASGTGARSTALRTTNAQLLGGADIPGGYNEGKEGYVYPLADIASVSGIPTSALGDGVNTLGHQQRWDILRDRVTESSQQNLVSAWNGGGADALTNRADAVRTLGVGTLMMVLPTVVFSVALLWYQLALGLMFALLGLVMFLAAFPRFGQQVLKDFLNKVLKYLVMCLVTLFFSSLTGVAAIGIPNLLFPANAAGLAASTLYFIVAFLCVGGLILAWHKVGKGFQRKTIIRGANERPAWDVAGKSMDLGKDAALNVGVAGAAVGLAVATGGVSAAPAVMSTLATSAVTGGKGNMRRSATRTMSETTGNLTSSLNERRKPAAEDTPTDTPAPADDPATAAPSTPVTVTPGSTPPPSEDPSAAPFTPREPAPTALVTPADTPTSALYVPEPRRRTPRDRSTSPSLLNTAAVAPKPVRRATDAETAPTGTVPPVETPAVAPVTAPVEAPVSVGAPVSVTSASAPLAEEVPTAPKPLSRFNRAGEQPTVEHTDSTDPGEDDKDAS